MAGIKKATEESSSVAEVGSPAEQEAPAAKKTESESDTREVELTDESGNLVGVTLKILPASVAGRGLDPQQRAAARIAGWTKLVLDGEVIAYSEKNAEYLVRRLSHVTDLVEKAGRT